MNRSPLFCLFAVCLVSGLVAGCATIEPRYAKTTGLIEPGMRAFAEFDARAELMSRQRGWAFSRLAPGAAEPGTVPPGVIYRWVLTGGVGADNQAQTVSMELIGVDVARPMKADERRVIVNGVPMLFRITLTGGVDLTIDDVSTSLSDKPVM